MGISGKKKKVKFPNHWAREKARFYGKESVGTPRSRESINCRGKGKDSLSYQVGGEGGILSSLLRNTFFVLGRTPYQEISSYLRKKGGENPYSKIILHPLDGNGFRTVCFRWGGNKEKKNAWPITRGPFLRERVMGEGQSDHKDRGKDLSS